MKFFMMQGTLVRSGRKRKTRFSEGFGKGSCSAAVSPASKQRPHNGIAWKLAWATAEFLGLARRRGDYYPSADGLFGRPLARGDGSLVQKKRKLAEHADPR